MANHEKGLPEEERKNQKPYLLRLRDVKTIPNDRLTRSLLRSALESSAGFTPSLSGSIPDLDDAYAAFIRDQNSGCQECSAGSGDYESFLYPYSSIELAGIKEAFENAKIESANRELLLLARENYNHLYNAIKDLPETREEDDLKILLFPKLLEKMIERERDHVKRFNLGFLKDSVQFWLSEKRSRDLHTNVLYYPYHMILGYHIGKNAHRAHLSRVFNEKAREVIEKRLRERNLFSDRREYFDYTQAPPSEWHSAAHQNTPVKHVYFDPRTYYSPNSRLSETTPWERLQRAIPCLVKMAAIIFASPMPIPL